MNLREFAYPPNIMSLSRIVLAVVIGYLLSRPELSAMWWSLGLVIVAALTDALDGYLARRLNRITALGVALDPIADKVFATVLVVGLIAFRDFPVWLAILAVGRDLLILLGGLFLLRGRRNLTLPSNLTGKWAFAALAVLLSAYIIRFQFSIFIMTPIVTALLTMSLIVYGTVFLNLRAGRSIEPFRDRTALKTARIALCSLVAGAHFWMFWVEYMR
jgi:CDP-diacylglycerol--glycerol-3-phosphate 3-phosphatidyltransferase